MREIKFRAWHNERKVMLPVSSWHFFDNTIWIESGESDKYGKLYRPYKADTEVIVMQYTGEKTQDGEEVYEGDIVETSKGLQGTVEYADGCFYLSLFGNDEEFNQCMCLKDWIIKRKLGNIYENPELKDAEVS